MNTKTPTKNAPVPTDAELRQTIIEARECGSRGAASRQPILASGAADALATLDRIRVALHTYYRALDNREHGGIASNRAFQEIQAAMGMFWQQKPPVKRELADPETCEHENRSMAGGCPDCGDPAL